MSRSTKHSPYHSFLGADSDRPGKAAANRRYRLESAAALQKGDEPPKQVKGYLDFPKEGNVRFDPARHPNMMRK